MTTYVRLRYHAAGRPTPVSCWAVKLGPRSYREVDREGDWGNDGTTTLVVVDPTDVVWEKPARMNLTYGTLETVP